ncbi:hypothetical protein VSX61_08850 [Brenneria populi subsp. brevivirga]|uniref:hypothetical protein n=1 Tax=Brenneria populi TaxID=1505588 RepID=UPI002E1788B4|nr:hypothetical protein [Brenneria populi subsp. brevivirga]
MAYQTGSATDLPDLLEKLSMFAAGLGWVVDGFTSGSSPTLYLHNADGYWSFGYGKSQRYTNQKYGLCICANTGYSSAAAWHSQPGTSHNAKSYYSGSQTTDLSLGAYISYDFFGTSQYLHAVVQIAAGVFRHFGIGTLNKEGDYIGGQYAHGSVFNISASSGRYGMTWALIPFVDYPPHSELEDVSSVVRADMLGGRDISPDYYPFGCSIRSAPTAIGVTGAPNYSSSYANHPDNFAVRTSRSALGAVVAPVPNAIIAICADGLYRRLGTVPDMYPCRIDGLTPRAQFEINGETWMTMPALMYQSDYQGGSNVTYGNSYDIGYAYRITP